MFREGYYLEVIKAKYSAATAVITIKEKIVNINIKNKKQKITTNKWMTLEDWSSLYEILEKALLQNNNSSSSTITTASKNSKLTLLPSMIEKKKFTKHLEITYVFEECENGTDRTSLPTIRVSVSSLMRKEKEKEKEKDKEREKKRKKNNKIEQDYNANSNGNKKWKNNDNDNENADDKNNRKEKINESDNIYNAEIMTDEYKIEEYIPLETCLMGNKKKKKSYKDKDKDNDKLLSKIIDNNSKMNANTCYIPSKKSTLEYLQKSSKNINRNEEYIPSNIVNISIKDNSDNEKDRKKKIKEKVDCGLVDTDLLYIPNSIIPNNTFSLSLSSSLDNDNKYISYNNLCEETYEPISLSINGLINSGNNDVLKKDQEYIPNSKLCLKNSDKDQSIINDEYQPHFINVTDNNNRNSNSNNINRVMKFDNSYIPSSSKEIRELKKKKKLNLIDLDFDNKKKKFSNNDNDVGNDNRVTAADMHDRKKKKQKL